MSRISKSTIELRLFTRSWENWIHKNTYNAYNMQKYKKYFRYLL